MKKLICAMVWMCAAGAARADFMPGTNTLALMGGAGGTGAKYDFEPGEERPVSGTGWAYGGQFLHYVKAAPAIAIGVDLLSSPNHEAREDDLLSNVDTTARTKSFIGMVVARLSYPKGTFRPYLFGGLGGYHATQTLTGTPHPGSTWSGGGTEVRTFIDESKTSFAMGGGIGLDIFVTESFFFGPELRGTWLAGMDTDDTLALRSAGYTTDNANAIGQGNMLMRAGFAF